MVEPRPEAVPVIEGNIPIISIYSLPKSNLQRFYLLMGRIDEGTYG